MTDLVEGLFSLHTIPPFVKKEDAFVRLLFQCIRDTSDVGRDRDIATEDYYRSVMTYWTLRADTHILRFSNVGANGKPFGNVSLVQRLHSVVTSNLKGKGYEIIEPEHERFEYFCNPQIFEQSGLDFLYAPDNKYIRTLVVIKRRR